MSWERAQSVEIEMLALMRERKREFVSCQCPAGYGESCPLTSDECTARESANREAIEALRPGAQPKR